MATASDIVITSTNTDDPKGEDNFDLENVDAATLPEEVAKAVKGFQGDYTKKMQALSDKIKEFEEKQKTDGDWNQWYAENQGLISEFNAWRAKTEEEDDSVVKNIYTTDDDDVASINAIRELEKKTNAGNEQMNTVFAEGFQMLVQLQKLSADAEAEGKPKPDPEKVIKYAQANGLVDVKKAYEGAYADEILETKITKAVEDAKATWDAKNKTDVLNQNMPQGREVRKVLAKDRGKK